jgi:transposase
MFAIPGVDQRGAEVIVAEIGIDMARFETARRLAAWAGVAPGNDESAGKQRSGKTRKGGADLTRPCGGAHQGDKSLSALSSPGRTAWEAAGDHGGGALDHAERLSYAFPQ